MVTNNRVVIIAAVLERVACMIAMLAWPRKWKMASWRKLSSNHPCRPPSCVRLRSAPTLMRLRHRMQVTALIWSVTLSIMLIDDAAMLALMLS